MLHVTDLTTLTDGPDKYLFDCDDTGKATFTSSFMSTELDTAWLFQKDSKAGSVDYYVQEVMGNMVTSSTSSGSSPSRQFEAQAQSCREAPQLANTWGRLTPDYKLERGLFYQHYGQARFVLFVKCLG